MSVHTLGPDEMDTIFRDQIAPVLFSSEAPPEQPLLVIVTGDRGAGSSRASSGVLRRHPGMARLNAIELRAFHPGFLEAEEPVDTASLAAAATAWTQSAIREARRSRWSLLIEGEGLTASAISGVVDLFRRDGYSTEVVHVASRRSDLLLVAISEHLRGKHASTLPATPRVGLGTEPVASATLEALRDSVDGITIEDRRGRVVLDERRQEGGDSFTAVSAALRDAAEAPRTALEAVQWLSELRRISELVASTRRPDRDTVAALIELHEIALNEVIPELPVPRGSVATGKQEREHAGRLIALHALLQLARVAEASGPSVGSAAIDRDGLGR